MASNAQFRDFTALEFQDRMMVGQLLSNSAHGIAGWNPNQIFYVDSNTGSSSYNGTSRAKPKATLAQAAALCNDSKGDVIILLPGHSETLAATGDTFSKIGVGVLGFGAGRNRPTLTCTNADYVGLTVSGTSNLFKNIRFVGGGSSQSSAASVILSLTGADNIVDGCVFEHGAGPLGCILLTNAHRTRLLNLDFLGTAAGPDFCIKAVGTAAPSNDVVIKGIRAQYSQASGLDSGVVINVNTTGVPGWDINDVRGIAIDGAVLQINTSNVATTVDSLATNCYGAFRTATSAAAAYMKAGTAVINCFWTDAATSLSPVLGVAFPITASVTNFKGRLAGEAVSTLTRAEAS